MYQARMSTLKMQKRHSPCPKEQPVKTRQNDPDVLTTRPARW